MKTPCVVLVEEQLRNISVSLRHSHRENKKGRGGGGGGVKETVLQFITNI